MPSNFFFFFFDKVKPSNSLKTNTLLNLKTKNEIFYPIKDFIELNAFELTQVEQFNSKIMFFFAYGKFNSILNLKYINFLFLCSFATIYFKLFIKINKLNFNNLLNFFFLLKLIKNDI